MQHKIPCAFAALIADRKGVSAIEYAIIAGLIAVTIVGAVSALGTHVNSSVAGVSNAFAANASTSSTTGTGTTGTGSTGTGSTGTGSGASNHHGNGDPHHGWGNGGGNQ